MKTYTIVEKRHIKQMNKKERDYLDKVIYKDLKRSFQFH